jgi:hypothetical protein
VKVTVTYETHVEVVVDTSTFTISSISVIRQLGSSLGGINGYVNVSHEREEGATFTKNHLRCALETIRTGKHPRWRWKEAV